MPVNEVTLPNILSIFLFTGIRYLEDEATAPLVDIGWRWSEKYGVRFRNIYDFQANENNLRFVLGRYSQDHAIFFGFSAIGTDLGLELSFSPTAGASSDAGAWAFTDRPDTNPWGIF